MQGEHDAGFAVLSPHFDDAVFSCGGLLAENPGRALVINVCTRLTGGFSRANIRISEARVDEDLGAASMLRFETVGLDELDAPLRSTHYTSPARLFLPPANTDADIPARIAARLRQLLTARRIGVLYAPLGIGWHVDHALAHLAARQIGPGFDVRYYEDAPYCLVAHATRYRLLELGATGWESEPDLARSRSTIGAWFDMSTDYCTMAPLLNFKPSVARPLAQLTVMGYFVRLLRAHAARQEGAGCTVRASKVPIDQVFEQKIDGCYCYRSQVDEFFMNRADCTTRYRRYAQGVGAAGGPAERYWTIQEAGHNAA